MFPIGLPLSGIPTVSRQQNVFVRRSPCNCEDIDFFNGVCQCSVEKAGRIAKKSIEVMLRDSDFFSSYLNQERTNGTNSSTPLESVKLNILQLKQKDIVVGSILGRGGFCDVHEVNIVSDVLTEENGKEENQKRLHYNYAIKSIKHTVKTQRKRFLRASADIAIEAHFLAALNHPHIIKLVGVNSGITLFNPSSPTFESAMAQIEPLSVFLILEKVHETLDDKIKDWKFSLDKYSGFFFRNTHDFRGCKRKALLMKRLHVALELATAMEYLHEKRIIYRDLKPGNVGFNAQGSLKLFDFGLAKELKPCLKCSDGTYRLTANTGSRRYMAPEVASSKSYNLSVDVYSYGILLCEICSLEKPFEGFTHQRHHDLVVKKGLRPKIGSKIVPEAVKSLIQLCWHKDMKRRPTFQDVVRVLKLLGDEFMVRADHQCDEIGYAKEIMQQHHSNSHHLLVSC